MSNESFAEHLGVAVRTVAAWHQKPQIRPKPEMQQLLDVALEQASPAVKARFAHLQGDTEPTSDLTQGARSQPSAENANSPGNRHAIDAERRLENDQYVHAALDWLDRAAGWDPGTSKTRVANRLAQLSVSELQHRGARRQLVNQRDIAEALNTYYDETVAEYGKYVARCGNYEAVTSILTHPQWLDLDSHLLSKSDRLTITSGVQSDIESALDSEAAEQAVRRIAETLALGIRLVNMPLYQLLEVDIERGKIGGKVGLTSFVNYALTMDLLEGEFIDELAADSRITHASLPLRDRYLPDTKTVLNLSERLCAGGVLGLCAIARPASFYNEADYLLIVQERSGHVLNAARKLAVIPKGFHQPLTDIRADSRIGATLLREIEEELFGRHDIDNTVTLQRSVDPMHPSRLSEPMRWLTEVPDALRLECTGFGLNLVSGNFEFASLIVIDNEDFWRHYGGQIEANWESSTLRRYSSLDSGLLRELIKDAAWSNEGLFALLQGLRRLARIGGSRVDLPTIEWEVRP